MFKEFLSIILKSLKLDKSLYKDNKNFEEASIYFAIIIILLISIISLVPGSILLKYMSGAFGINDTKGPSIRFYIIMSIIGWLIKTAYLYFIGVVVFPNKSTKCNFRKLLIVVAYANAPFIFYIFIFNIKLIYFTFVPYLWYSIALIIGVNEVLKYNNYIKTTIITLAPQIILLIYFFSQALKISNGVVS